MQRTTSTRRTATRRTATRRTATLLLSGLLFAGACADGSDQSVSVVDLAPQTDETQAQAPQAHAPQAQAPQAQAPQAQPTAEPVAEAVAVPTDETAEIFAAATGVMSFFFSEDRQAAQAALDEFGVPTLAAALEADPPLVGLAYQFEDHWLVEIGPGERELHTCVNLLPGLGELNDSTFVALYTFHAVQTGDRWLISGIDTGRVSTLAECRAGKVDESAAHDDTAALDESAAMAAAASGFMNVFYMADLESSLTALDEYADPLVAMSMESDLELYWNEMPPIPGITYDLANSWVEDVGPTSGHLTACGHQLFLDMNVTPERDFDVLRFTLVRADDRWLVDGVDALGTAPLAACEADTLDSSLVTRG